MVCFMFKTDLEHIFPSRKFSIADKTWFSGGCFFRHVMLILNFLNCNPFTYLWRRDFYTPRKRETVPRMKRALNIAKEHRETDSALFCGGLS